MWAQPNVPSHPPGGPRTPRHSFGLLHFPPFSPAPPELSTRPCGTTAPPYPSSARGHEEPRGLSRAGPATSRAKPEGAGAHRDTESLAGEREREKRGRGGEGERQGVKERGAPEHNLQHRTPGRAAPHPRASGTTRPRSRGSGRRWRARRGVGEAGPGAAVPGLRRDSRSPPARPPARLSPSHRARTRPMGLGFSCRHSSRGGSLWHDGSGRPARD